jgi:NADPH-dependent glutamate synthase beta subunit-like oxidoreductase
MSVEDKEEEDMDGTTTKAETGSTLVSYRRFKDGDRAWSDLTQNIFKAGWSHKCPTYVHRSPPCQGSCPSGHDIRGWFLSARGIDKPPVAGMPWQEYAFRRMVEANPFPAVMGRVCPAPCEAGCNRNAVDDFVGINAIEHYVGDWAIERGLALPGPESETGKRVAVIGGGPAGLAAAYFLRRKGHTVTVFEAHDELGGMMRYGIPGYRTPRDKLSAEIQRILDIGVKVHTGVRVGRDLTIVELEDDFDAIFWALGAQAGRPLPVPGFDAPNCVSGVDFLKAFNTGQLLAAVQRVVVVGGGDTSIDVASVARRLGYISHPRTLGRAEDAILGRTAQDVAGIVQRQGVAVVLTSLFPMEQMTAAPREREDAMREGVDVRCGVMPLEVLKGPDGRARGLRMCACDMKGMTPIPRPGTEFEIAGDLIVSAIGQMGDFADLKALDNGKGFIDADPLFAVKGRPKHFAGGDILRPHLLTTAVGHGRIAAESIDQFVRGEEAGKRPKVDAHHFDLLTELRQRHLEPEEYRHEATRGTSSARFAVHNYEDRAFAEIVPHRQLFLGHFAYEPRNRRREVHIAADQVLGNFQERIEGFTEAQAIAESKRCMSCGLCFECDNCVIFCPQGAVQRVKKAERAIGRYVETDYNKCIGCHICADVCPTGYIQMGLGE